MASIWSGAIAFGLVNIPIKLYNAVHSDNLELDMLDSKDLERIHYKRVNEKTGKEVPWEQIVKGYKYEDRYIVLDDKDFQKAAPEQTREIGLDFFCEAAQIDPIYYETAYYAEPDKSGLREALVLTEKVAVGSFVLRNREHLCVLRPFGKDLLVQTIHYQTELRAREGDAPSTSTPKPAELKMATALINQLSASFDISHLKDTYNDKLMEFIKAKAKGKKTAAAPLRVAHKAPADLLEQLKASMQTKRKRAAS
jgi:DNA end-binding protein Ku